MAEAEKEADAFEAASTDMFGLGGATNTHKSSVVTIVLSRFHPSHHTHAYTRTITERRLKRTGSFDESKDTRATKRGPGASSFMRAYTGAGANRSHDRPPLVRTHFSPLCTAVLLHLCATIHSDIWQEDWRVRWPRQPRRHVLHELAAADSVHDARVQAADVPLEVGRGGGLGEGGVHPLPATEALWHAAGMLCICVVLTHGHAAHTQHTQHITAHTAHTHTQHSIHTPHHNTTQHIHSTSQHTCSPLCIFQETSRRSISTTDLTKSFGWNSHNSFVQHDVQELLRVLLNALEDSFSGRPEITGAVAGLYNGRFDDYVECLRCRVENGRPAIFMDVSLVIQPFGSTHRMRSVEEALRYYLGADVLTGDNQYECEACGKLSDARKGQKFKELPYILTLQLKRFDYDFAYDRRVKINDRVSERVGRGGGGVAVSWLHC